ncbi:MAG: hypothetical protein PHO79_10940 [Desulfoplanes sp.]|nr:hypothetical protein [Desulfoplanes sp.]MDD4650506.1 hypothetical protein [Desulfoplanes sp.]
MNNQNLSAAESKLIEDLEAEIAAFEEEKKTAARKVRELMASEDLINGVYHNQEIFILKQDQLRLKTEIMFRTNKINRLRFT